MKINITSLKTEVNTFNRLIESYEEIYLNLYNELLLGANYWIDDISRNFYGNVQVEKLKVKNTIIELMELKKIYEDLIQKYEKFGSKIEVVLDSKDILLSKFDCYFKKIYEIIELYRELKLDDYLVEKSMIIRQMNQLIRSKNNMVELKKKIKIAYETIEEIEKEVLLNISKLKIEYINDIGINKFLEEI